jgi:hypothetical protein
VRRHGAHRIRLSLLQGRSHHADVIMTLADGRTIVVNWAIDVSNTWRVRHMELTPDTRRLDQLRDRTTRRN